MRGLGLLHSTIIMACLIFSIACVSPASKHTAQGDTYFQQGQWEQAIIEYEEASKIAPAQELNSKLASAYAQQAMVHYDKKEYDNAIADYERAYSLLPTVEVNPKLADAYVQRGTRAYTSENYDMAISDLDKAIQMNPNSAPCYLYRCKCYEAKSGYDDKVITDCSKAIALDLNLDATQLAEAYRLRAYAYMYEQEYNKARLDLDIAISLLPEGPTNTHSLVLMYSIRGMCYMMMGLSDDTKYNNALFDFNKAIGLEPDGFPLINGNVYLYRAEIYIMRGEFAKAKADLEKVAKSSQNPDAVEEAKRILTGR